ncbi:MAG: hypothetical protein AAGH99_03705 [Planctomycetota bacterium]
MVSLTQLRGIQQGMMTFSAASHRAGGDGRFPGLDRSGRVVPDGEATGFSGDGTQPAARLWMLLDGNFFTPEYIINPADGKAAEYEFPPNGEASPDHPLTSDHFSYAMLGITEALNQDEDGNFAPSDDTRANEWLETLNPNAIVMSDRAIGTDRDDISSVWTEPGSGEWRGGVIRNDNSTSFETIAEFEQTQYGDAEANDLDHLFEDAPGVTDAFLVHEDATTAYSVE